MDPGRDVRPPAAARHGSVLHTAIAVLGVVVVVLGVDGALRPLLLRALDDPAWIDLARRTSRLGDPRLHGARWWAPSVGFVVASIATAVAIAPVVGRGRAVGVALVGTAAGLAVPWVWATSWAASTTAGWVAQAIAGGFGVALVQVATPGRVRRVWIERVVGVAGVSVLAVFLDRLGVGPFAFGVAPAATAAFVVVAVRAPTPAPIGCGRWWIAIAAAVAAVVTAVWFASRRDDDHGWRGAGFSMHFDGVIVFAGCLGLAFALRRPGRAHLVPAWCVLVGLAWGAVVGAPRLAFGAWIETRGSVWVVLAGLGLGALVAASVLAAAVGLLEPEARAAGAFGSITGAFLGAVFLSLFAAPFLDVGAAAIWQVIVGIAIAAVLEPRPPHVPPAEATPDAMPARKALPDPWGGSREQVR